MYFDAKIIDGRLYTKTSPNGEWTQAIGNMAQAVESLCRISVDERQTVLALFCSRSGAIKT